MEAMFSLWQVKQEKLKKEQPGGRCSETAPFLPAFIHVYGSLVVFESFTFTYSHYIKHWSVLSLKIQQ